MRCWLSPTVSVMFGVHLIWDNADWQLPTQRQPVTCPDFALYPLTPKVSSVLYLVHSPSSICPAAVAERQAQKAADKGPAGDGEKAARGAAAAAAKERVGRVAAKEEEPAKARASFVACQCCRPCPAPGPALRQALTPAACCPALGRGLALCSWLQGLLSPSKHSQDHSTGRRPRPLAGLRP